MELIQINKLSKHYTQGPNKVKALDEISLTIKKGDFVAIVGPSGSGKSTLLHILAGVDNATHGSVLIDNTDITKLSDKKLTIFRRRHIGLIYQFFNLIPLLDVKENILLPLDLDGRKVSESQISELLESLSLTNRQHHFPSQLSGGQQQRVAIGRALMNRPSILLADEPTGNLDRAHSDEIVHILKTMNESLNQTIIIVTHDEDVASSQVLEIV